MAFVQIMEFTTSRFEEGQALEREWEALPEGRRTIRRQIAGRDRNSPDETWWPTRRDSSPQALLDRRDYV